jgi:hypothetical protein
MANKKPVCKFPAKYVGLSGETISTQRVRVPEYLAEEIEAIAQELHQRRLAEGTVPANK